MSATDLGVETKIKLKQPTLYKVLLLNDDFTPLDFVIEILKTIFQKSHSEAYKLAQEVHEKGKGLAGVYTKEIAEQKVSDVLTISDHYSHPLRVISEPA